MAGLIRPRMTFGLWLLWQLNVLLLFGPHNGIAAEPDEDADRIAVATSRPSAQMPEGLATAYRNLFDGHDKEAIEGLLRSESSSIALRAAWRLAELKCTERPDSSPLLRFLGFVEGRTKARIPGWWDAMILGSRLHWKDRRWLKPYLDADVDDAERFHRVDFGNGGLTLPPGVEIKEEADLVLWTNGDITTRIPRCMFIEDGMNLGDLATMAVSSDRMYLLVADDMEGSFTLSCLTSDGKEVWRSMGWGTGELRGNASGLWGASCEIQLTDHEVVVFGEATFGLFLEAFRRESGQPLYRFCTRYIEEQDLRIGER